MKNNGFRKKNSVHHTSKIVILTGKKCSAYSQIEIDWLIKFKLIRLLSNFSHC